MSAPMPTGPQPLVQTLTASLFKYQHVALPKSTACTRRTASSRGIPTGDQTLSICSPGDPTVGPQKDRRTEYPVRERYLLLAECFFFVRTQPRRAERKGSIDAARRAGISLAMVPAGSEHSSDSR